jgi:hypothetical protein
LGGRYAVGADSLQWIVYRAWSDGKLHPVSFVRSTKHILLRCLKDAGCDLANLGEEAQRALDALPATFKEWQAGQGEGVEEAPALQPCIEDISPAQKPRREKRKAYEAIAPRPQFHLLTPPFSEGRN